MRLSTGLEVPELVAWMNWNLAFSNYGAGEYEEAARRFEESFDYMAAENYQEGVASAAVGAGLCAIQPERPESGIELFGAADTTFERIGTVIWPEAEFHVQAVTERINEEKGRDFYTKHYSAGRQLSFAETIDLTADVFIELTSG